METRLERHRRKLRGAGVTRFSVQLPSNSVETLRRLCREHGKTQAEVLGLALQAADALLVGRLQVAKPRIPDERTPVRAELPTVPVSEPQTIAEQPQQLPSAEADGGEPWWPSNYHRLPGHGEGGNDD